MSPINCKGFNVFLLGKDKNTDGEHAFFAVHPDMTKTK